MEKVFLIKDAIKQMTLFKNQNGWRPISFRSSLYLIKFRKVWKKDIYKHNCVNSDSKGLVIYITYIKNILLGFNLKIHLQYLFLFMIKKFNEVCTCI